MEQREAHVLCRMLGTKEALLTRRLVKRPKRTEEEVRTCTRIVRDSDKYQSPSKLRRHFQTLNRRFGTLASQISKKRRFAIKTLG
jgi:hypothetical protein